jgi:putative ABC transport system permease protein
MQFLDELRHDVRYALRLLRSNPAFALVVISILGLGIGASATVFSFVSSLVLRPLNIDDVGHVAQLFEQLPGTADRQRVAFANFIDWQTQNNVFEYVSAFRFENPAFSAIGEPERILSMRASAEIFPLLHTRMAIGRPFTPDDDRPGAEPVVVLTNAFWRVRFGADPHVVGQKVRLDGNTATVVGVLQEDPDYFGLARVWTPLALSRATNGRSTHFLSAVARLKPNITLQRAQAEMDIIASRLTDNRIDGRRLGVRVLPFQDSLVDFIYPALSVGMAAAALLLVIACANIANIVLARGAARTKEIAVRSSLGASRSRIVSQLLTESAILSSAGAVAGVLICKWGVSALVALSPEDQRLVDIAVDGRVLAFVTLTTVLTTFLFGLLPALKVSAPVRYSTRHRARNILVISEVALAVVLLAGAGLLVKSYLRVQSVTPGLRTQNVLTLQVAVPQAKYGRNVDVSRFYDDVLERVRRLPGVESAALVQSLPFAGRSNFATFEVKGAPSIQPNENYGLALQQIVSTNYLQAADIKLIAGRSFSDHDGPGAPGVAVINEALAARVWKGKPAHGDEIRIGPPEWGLPWLTIIGVTSNVMHYGLDQRLPLEIYVPFSQVPVREMFLVVNVVNTQSEPIALAATVRKAIFEFDPDQPISAIRAMNQVIDDSLWQRRVLLQLIVLFAAVALALSCVGVYGAISYSMEQRRKEFGIRIALGAARGNILRLGISEGMKLAAAGALIGLIAGAIINKRMTKLLFEVEPTDLTTYCGITALLLAVAFLAAYLPARKALKVDPTTALKLD